MFWGFDPALVSYMYGSPPGIMLLTVRALASAWFTYACLKTMVNYKRNRFYRFFFAAGLIWILALPLCAILILLASIVYRAVLLYIFELLITIYGHVAVAILWILFKFNRIFPFHKSVMLVQKKLKKKYRQGATALSGGFGVDAGSLDDMHYATAVDKAFEAAKSIKYKILALEDRSDELIHFLGELKSYHDLDDREEENKAASMTSASASGSVEEGGNLHHRVNISREGNEVVDGGENGKSNRELDLQEKRNSMEL